jgi:hypothetical protein
MSVGSDHRRTALGVNGIQDRSHPFARRCRQVADAIAAAGDVRAELPGQVLVRHKQLAGVVRLVFLHQIERSIIYTFHIDENV